MLGPDGLPREGVVPIVQVDGPLSKHVFSPPPIRSYGQTGFEINVEDLRPGKIVTYQVFVSREYGIGQGAGGYIAALARP